MPTWDEMLKGTSGDDVINGGSGDDFLQGRAGGDVLDGGAGNDQIHGDDGADHLRGGEGDDTIVGGLGFDTAYYTGSVAEYQFYMQSNGWFTLSHTGGSQIDGDDWLQHVERLVFADAIIDLGVNNAPIAANDSASTNEDVGTYSSGSASVLDNDFDWEGDTLTVTPGIFNGTFGTLVLNADGTYTYTPSASAQSLAQGQVVQDVFNYTVSDGSLTDTGTLTINLSGLNDGPVANPDTASTSENAVANIDVLANDTDVDNGAVLTVTAASAPAGQGTASVVGNQVQFDPGTDFDYLAVGESTVVVINYSIQDEHGATSSSTVNLTVTGTNDAPTIDAGGTTATGSATELPDGDPGENVDIHTASGTVAFDDLDLSDTHSASFTPQAGGYLGTFTLDPVNQAGDSVGWDFNVSDADLDFLDEGETLVQVYTIEIDDGNGGTTTQDVTITLTGAGDGPQTEWYIDNSAVGSANLGTSADPYTSIAAFNAAQGTISGPQVGHTVYLLTGTGTGVYAEADGINLIDDQILVGVPSGSVRPTIEAAAGDGVNLALNNNVSGFDIGSVSGAGIADSGGSVGNLSLSDVAKSGSGQIADIDQGGTLNVTLNSAASTASSGGAIDLAGVGGSFTVTGATTIAGVHAGGGVDVTGSSVSVSLTGGGLVSTGANNAVNFGGNSGSLTLGGGFDIVTTSGAGLVATAGGTVTVTGAGNSVTTTTGNAVAIVGTTIGAADITFESVSSTGAINTIILNNTGALGGLTVTGAGVAGSGGVMTGNTGAVVVATNTQDLNLSWVTISNSAGQAISASNLRGDNSLTDSLVSGFGTGSGNTVDAIRIVNNNVNLDRFTVSNTTFSNGSAGNDVISIDALGTSDMRLNVDGSTFTGIFGEAVQVVGSAASSGDVDVTISDSDFLNSVAARNGGVTFVSLGSMTMRVLVEDSTFDNVMKAISNLGAISATNGGTATAHLTFRNNLIEDLPGGRPITVTADGGTTFLAVEGNTIDRLGSTSKPAINANFLNAAVADVIVSDNLIGQNGNLWTAGNGLANAIFVGGQTSTNIDVLIDGNVVSANSSVEAVRVRTINASTMNATVSNNVMSDTAGAHVEFDASDGVALGTSVLNLNIFGNDLPNAGVGVIRLSDATGGVLNVTQLSAADVSVQNDNATVTQIGTVNYGAPPPPLPIVPDLPTL